MAILTVGPTDQFLSIAAAMVEANPGDTIILSSGYSNETASVTVNMLTIVGASTSTGIQLDLVSGITAVELAGEASIDVVDSASGNDIDGNAGDNRITVTAGVDNVTGGLGNDVLIVDYRLATGAVTGDSTSNFTEAGGGGRTVTIADAGFEQFVVLTGAGADTITTHAGDDFLSVGDGANTVTAGQGANTILGGDDADTITALDGGNFVDAGDGANTVTTGGGNDTIIGGTGADSIVSGIGDDEIYLSGGFDTVAAGAGNDLMIVNYSALTSAVSSLVFPIDPTGHAGVLNSIDAVISFSGVDRFFVTLGSGDDSIGGGDLADTLVGALGNDFLNGAIGDDLIYGNQGFDSLDGGEGDDLIYGGQGDDFLLGQGGDDVLVGGVGFDLLDGGSGSDTAAYEQSQDAVTVTLLANGFPQFVSAHQGGDLLVNIENLIGSRFNDILEGDGGANSLKGALGNDTLTGGFGDDSLLGGEGDDFLYGNQSGDVLDGGAGNDWLHGGQDNDVLVGGTGDDTLNGGLGYDTVDYSAASTGVTVNLGILVPQLVSAGEGTDILSNFESVIGSEFADHLVGDAMQNTLIGALGNDTLEGGFGSDELLGGEGNDSLLGNQDNDLLIGGDGDDWIHGGQGDDLLIGGAGNDTLFGGLGEADFIFDNVPDALTNVDVIGDFKVGVDKIILSVNIFQQFSSNPIEFGDYLIYNDGASTLSYDADGAGIGGAVLFAIVDPLLSGVLTADDFSVGIF